MRNSGPALVTRNGAHQMFASAANALKPIPRNEQPCLGRSLPMAGGWNQVFLKDPFNPNRSRILWYRVGREGEEQLRCHTSPAGADTSHTRSGGWKCAFLPLLRFCCQRNPSSWIHMQKGGRGPAQKSEAPVSYRARAGLIRHKNALLVAQM